MPVVLPQRITTDPELLHLLRKYGTRKQLCVVTQFNHPKEITTESSAAVKMLLETGIPVRNQTVLLKGVNDEAQVLGTLLRKLTRTGVIPYYIFQCRPGRANAAASYCLTRPERLRFWEIMKTGRCCLSITRPKIRQMRAGYLRERSRMTGAGCDFRGRIFCQRADRISA